MRRSTLIWGTLMCALLCALGVAAAPVAQTNPFEQLVFDTRSDLDSTTVVSDLWFDTEQLANAIFGPEERPLDWIDASVPVNEILARNVRHDLELSADE